MEENESKPVEGKVDVPKSSMIEEAMNSAQAEQADNPGAVDPPVPEPVDDDDRRYEYIMKRLGGVEQVLVNLDKDITELMRILVKGKTERQLIDKVYPDELVIGTPTNGQLKISGNAMEPKVFQKRGDNALMILENIKNRKGNGGA